MVKLRPDMKHVDDPDLLEPLWDGPMANQLSGADGKISNAQAKWGRGYWQQDMDQQCYTGVHRTAVSTVSQTALIVVFEMTARIAVALSAVGCQMKRDAVRYA